MTNAYSSTNPNAFGGSFNYDSRTGAGIGSLSKHPASGLGSNWNMGDALSSPKGEWDDFDEEDILDDEDEINDLELKVNRKASKSYNVTATDSLSHKGTSIGYMGGIGSDMSAVIGLSAGKEIKGQSLVENYIREVLKEYSSISGNIAVQSKAKAKNFGGKNNAVYKIDKTTSHTNSLDNSSSRKSQAINRSGYGNKARTPQNLEPYVVPGLAADTDGSRFLYTDKHELENLEDEIAFNSGKSSYEFIIDDVEQEDSDILNFLNNNKRRF